MRWLQCLLCEEFTLSRAEIATERSQDARTINK